MKKSDEKIYHFHTLEENRIYKAHIANHLFKKDKGRIYLKDNGVGEFIDITDQKLNKNFRMVLYGHPWIRRKVNE